MVEIEELAIKFPGEELDELTCETFDYEDGTSSIILNHHSTTTEEENAVEIILTKKQLGELIDWLAEIHDEMEDE